MSFEEVRARNAAEKAAGIKRVYSHGGRAKIGTARTALPVLADCIHGGTDADIVERCPSCSGGGKHVRECAVHEKCTWEPVNPAVMDCRRCRREGLGFATKVTPVPAVAPLAAGIIVPQPPPLSLTPTSARAIVTVVVGDEAKRLFAVSGPYMRAYARRLGADLVVIDWPGHPDWPMSAKFGIARVLDHYERIAYVDADVLLRPGCLDLFGMCAPHEFGVVDELQHHRQHPKFGQEPLYQKFRKEMGFAEVPNLPWMFNAGVMVAPRAHRELLLPPTKPIALAHCSEQEHTNAKLLDSGLPYRLMDRRTNWQNWTDHDFKAAPRDAVLHWSGAGHDRVSRAELMREFAERYPLFDPPAPSHEWEIDRRHLLWLSDVLLSRRYRRVLEIGSYRGYSARAFLHALAAGVVDEVHLCDVAPTDELRALVAVSGVADRVTIHTCPSTELLARDGHWDLVFLDGDHSAANVQKESRLLIAAGAKAIFAHDTRNPNCAGPAILRVSLESAGYTCEEDACDRASERTERGMLFASRA